MRTTNIHDKIKSVACKALTLEKVETDQDLIESGVLDSLALVQLMVALEEAFEITIPPEELEIEDYRSVNTISEMINRISYETTLKNYA